MPSRSVTQKKTKTTHCGCFEWFYHVFFVCLVWEELVDRATWIQRSGTLPRSEIKTSGFQLNVAHPSPSLWPPSLPQPQREEKNTQEGLSNALETEEHVASVAAATIQNKSAWTVHLHTRNLPACTNYSYEAVRTRWPPRPLQQLHPGQVLWTSLHITSSTRSMCGTDI